MGARGVAAGGRAHCFEVARGGLLATLTAPHGAALTLPMVAWEGLLDALAASRKTRTRNDKAFPARSGARWYDGEANELAAAFKGGRSIPQLARAHNRTEFAVEAQLERLGLWDREERRPKRGEGPAAIPAADIGGVDDHPPFPGGQDRG